MSDNINVIIVASISALATVTVAVFTFIQNASKNRTDAARLTSDSINASTKLLIDTLQSRIDHLEQRSKEQEERISELSEENIKIREQMANDHLALTVAQRTLETTKAELTVTEDRLREALGTVERLTQERESLATRVSELERQIAPALTEQDNG